MLRIGLKLPIREVRIGLKLPIGSIGSFKNIAEKFLTLPPRSLGKKCLTPLQVVKIIHKYIGDIPKRAEEHFSVCCKKYKNRNKFRFNLEKSRFINTNLDL